MKKLLSLTTMAMIALATPTLSAATTANTNKEIKKNNLSQTIDYSKMNYKQIKAMWEDIRVILGDPKGNACARFKWYNSVILPQLETNHKKASKLYIECLKQIIPLEKEVINRLKKYSNNEEVYKMYIPLKNNITDYVKMLQISLNTQEEVLKKQKLEEQY